MTTKLRYFIEIKRHFPAVAVLVAAQWMVALVVAGDWTHFRGPKGNGISNEVGLPTELEAYKHISWQIALKGRGLSSPIVLGERVFVTSSRGANYDRLSVQCFKASDGKLLWERTTWATGRTMTHPHTSVAAPTPATDGERIYALFSSNDLVCYDLDGNLLWLRGLTRDYANASNSLGMASSPMVLGDTLVVQVENDSESFAAGIDIHDGTNRWKLDRPKMATWTSPVPLDLNGRKLVVLQSGKGLHVIEPSSGEEVWQYSDGADTMASTAVVGDTLYVPSHGITAIKAPGADEPLVQLWRANQMRPAFSSPTVIGERYFVLNNAGVLSAGDTLTGERVWQLRLDGPFNGSPVAVGSYLYIASGEGVLQVVKVGAEQGEVVGTLALGDAILCTPAVANGALFIRSDTRLWKIAGALVL